MQSSGTRHDFALTPLEYDVLCAVVTKFATDLVLFRLAKPMGGSQAAALEEVASSTAIMLNEGRPATQIESLALQAIVESVGTGSEPEFFEALCGEDALPFSADRLRQLLSGIHTKLSDPGFQAAA